MSSISLPDKGKRSLSRRITDISTVMSASTSECTREYIASAAELVVSPGKTPNDLRIEALPPSHGRDSKGIWREDVSFPRRSSFVDGSLPFFLGVIAG